MGLKAWLKSLWSASPPPLKDVQVYPGEHDDCEADVPHQHPGEAKTTKRAPRGRVE